MEFGFAAEDLGLPDIAFEEASIAYEYCLSESDENEDREDGANEDREDGENKDREDGDSER